MVNEGFSNGTTLIECMVWLGAGTDITNMVSPEHSHRFNLLLNIIPNLSPVACLRLMECLFISYVWSSIMTAVLLKIQLWCAMFY